MYLRKDGAEDTTNPHNSIEIHGLLVAPGNMFWIRRLVGNTALNTICEFGDSGSDIVIDAEGHRSVCHCLVPNNRLSKPIFYRSSGDRCVHMTVWAADNQTARCEILLQLREKPFTGCEATNEEDRLCETWLVI